jgi:hypothetical protein
MLVLLIEAEKLVASQEGLSSIELVSHCT